MQQITCTVAGYHVSCKLIGVLNDSYSLHEIGQKWLRWNLWQNFGGNKESVNEGLRELFQMILQHIEDHPTVRGVYCKQRFDFTRTHSIYTFVIAG